MLRLDTNNPQSKYNDTVGVPGSSRSPFLVDNPQGVAFQNQKEDTQSLIAKAIQDALAGMQQASPAEQFTQSLLPNQNQSVLGASSTYVPSSTNQFGNPTSSMSSWDPASPQRFSPMQVAPSSPASPASPAYSPSYLSSLISLGNPSGFNNALSSNNGYSSLSTPTPAAQEGQGFSSLTSPTPSASQLRSSSDNVSAGIALALPELKKSEGFRSYSYDDGTGVQTIGYGDTRGDVVNRGYISEQEASNLLAQRFENDYLKPALSLIPESVRKSLTPGQVAAIGSFAYNAGVGGFAQSDFGRAIIAGNLKLASDVLPTTYINAGTNVEQGLRNRRLREQALFNA